jgi:nucleotide-binding universal stress UspA family protein
MCAASEAIMFRYILVPATGRDADVPVFRTAAGMASATGGHVLFLHVRLDVQRMAASVAASDVGGTTALSDVLQNLEQVATKTEARAREQVLAFCKEEKLTLADYSPLAERPSATWQVQTGDEARVIAAYGRAADVTVLDRRRTNGTADLHMLQTVLLDSGRPILITPDRPPRHIGRRVAIAWKDTPEAARAVAFALPWLAAAERVIIVSVEEDARTSDAACERLRQALIWHNPTTMLRHVTPNGRDPAEALLTAVGAQNADLLVMGGYGHSRLREVVFGGVTRHVLQAADVPVLMAH